MCCTCTLAVHQGHPMNNSCQPLHPTQGQLCTVTLSQAIATCTSLPSGNCDNHGSVAKHNCHALLHVFTASPAVSLLAAHSSMGAGQGCKHPFFYTKRQPHSSCVIHRGSDVKTYVEAKVLAHTHSHELDVENADPARAARH